MSKFDILSNTATNRLQMRTNSNSVKTIAQVFNFKYDKTLLKFYFLYPQTII